VTLNTALVDRARTVSFAPAGPKVRGSTQFAYVRSEWFKARLTLPASTESTDGSGSRRKQVREPTLLVGVKDLQGQPFTLSSDDRIQVRAAGLGEDSVWDVVGNPEPLRKKRRVIGFQVTLKRVEDSELPQADVAGASF
jgi:hypothetical protein